MLNRRATLLALSLVLTGALTACSDKPVRGTAVPAEAHVLALGDSLTAGVGAKAGEDWPSLLAERTEWNITNAGISGDTSAQGLARLPELLQAHSPSLVIVGLGGNDFLRRAPAAQTTAALRSIVQAARAAQAQVVLLAIPQPSLMAAAGAKPADHPLYQELAKELKVPLISNIWGPILGDANLRSDQVHANAQGYAAFAQALEAALRAQGFLAH